jgi:DNA-binding response OmpR family regulator
MDAHKIQVEGPFHVLLLEPDPEQRQAAVWCLESVGYQVTQAESADQVLALISRTPADLVVLGGSAALIPGVRQLAGRRSISVLLVCDPLELEADAENAGYADDFLLRPARPIELLVRVRALVKLKQTREQRRNRAHDMKNPLTAILANCQYLIRHVDLEGEAREVVGDIASSAGHLGRMIDPSARSS